MEIRKWQFCVLISCVFVLQNYVVSGKTFSLNDVVAEESKRLRRLESSSSPVSPLGKLAEKFSFLRTLGDNTKNRKIKRSGINTSEVLPTLHLKKKFQIKNPLKQNNLLKEHRARLKRKNQHLKRETNHDEGINEKYMPLFKSLSFLFDGILDNDLRESGGKLGRRGQRAPDTGIVCQCARKPDLEDAESQPAKTTVAAAPPDATRYDAEIPSAQTDTIAHLHIGNIKHHKKLPSLPPRDSVGIRRDRHGVRARNGAADQSSAEGYIPRTDGGGRLRSRLQEIYSTRKSVHKHSEHPSRDHAGDDKEIRIRRPGDESSDHDRKTYKQRQTTNNKQRQTTNNYSVQSHAEDSEPDRSDIVNPETFNIKVGGHEKHGKTVLPDSRRETGSDDRKGRSDDRKGRMGNDQQTSLSQEKYESTEVDPKHDSTDDKGLVDSIGSDALAENQKTDEAIGARITLQDLSKATPPMPSGSKTQAPMVTIFDGYSVARDKNGANKLNEKSIRIHS